MQKTLRSLFQFRGGIPQLYQTPCPINGTLGKIFLNDFAWGKKESYKTNTIGLVA
jgi:hypothetical protein